MTPTMMTDAQLDGAFYQSWNVKDFPTAQTYGAEIRDRLLSVGSFWDGLMGTTRFPKYDKIIQSGGGFGQVEAARGSTADAAKNVATTIGSAVSDTVSGVVDTAKKGFTVSAVVIAVVAVAAIAVATRK